MGKLLTVREVAQRLRASRATVYRYIEQSGLPTVRVMGLVRVDAAELDRWIEDQKKG